MSFKTFSLLSVVCVSLAFVGCESQRYKPADWRSAGNSTLADRTAATAVASKEKDKKNWKRPESPTNWMELSGTGGEAAAQRRAYGTMPSRYGATSLPWRNGTSMPQRNGTSMPWRSGTSLPNRGYGSNTSLPSRQNGYRTGVSSTTIPQRGRYQSGSTLPGRNSGGTLPRR